MRIKGRYDDAFYRERISRSAVFLGTDDAQVQRSQDRISQAVVGVAGLGAVGGGVAMMLARLGVRYIKIADFDTFDVPNINRQTGASAQTVGQQKTAVIADMIHQTMPDVTIDIYSDGVQVDNAADFVSECDLLIDCIDFHTIAERYALHRAFRASDKCRGCLSSKMVGFGANLYLFTPDGVTLEDFYGIAPNTEISPARMDRLTRLQTGVLPRFPSLETIKDWMQENRTAPMISTTPALTHYMIGSRVALMLAGLNEPPYCEPLPPMPQFLWVDATRMQCEIHTFDGSYVNEGEFERHFPEE